MLVLLEKCFGHTLSQISSLSALSSFAWVRTSRETSARPLYSFRSFGSASPNGREASTRSLHRSRSFHTPSSPFEKLPNDLYTVHKAYTRPLHRSRSFRTLFTPFEKLPHALYTVHKAYTRPLHRSRSFCTLFTPFDSFHTPFLPAVCSAR